MSNDNTLNINDTIQGSSEYNAFTHLGAKRRVLTGILSIKNKERAFSIASWIAKPFSVIGSAFGFATIVSGIANQDIFSVLWFILLIIGLFIGAFFEYLSTANEDSFLPINLNNMRITGIIFIVLIKSYAVFMHYQTAKQIQSFLLGDNIKTPMIELIKEDIKSLENQIKLKQSEITEDLIKNTTSIYISKRNDAIKLKKEIETEIKRLQAELSKKRLELIAQIKRDKESKISENSGLVWTFFILLVIFELGGTITSILSKRVVLNGTDENLATIEAVKNQMLDNKSALDYSRRKTKVFELKNQIETVDTNLKIAEKHTEVTREQMKVEEELIQAEEKLNNKKNELLAKRYELQSKQIELIIDDTKKEIEKINDTIHFINNKNYIDIDIEQGENMNRKIGFALNELDKEKAIRELYKNGEVKEGDKLTPKHKIVDVSKMKNNKFMVDLYKELQNRGHIQYMGVGRTGGYYAISNLNEVLKDLK